MRDIRKLTEEEIAKVKQMAKTQGDSPLVSLYLCRLNN